MKRLLFILVLFVLACAKPAWHELEKYDFESYLRDFSKSYDGQEYEFRKNLFQQNLNKIHEINRSNRSWKAGVNRLTDKTEEELGKLLGYRLDMHLALKQNKTSTSKRMHSVISSPLSSLPRSVDWRTKGVITDPKDQGGCGSCWTFGTAETVESHYAIKTGKLVVLSEQQIIDCTPNPNQCGGTGGCEGGTAEIAYDQIVKSGGLALESDYPYAAADGTCQASTPKAVKISGYVEIPSNQYLPVITALATVGPLSISVDASSWTFYESGVYSDCDMSSPDIDHEVQLVGYGTDDSHGDYWLIRNSWGGDWGESGYIRISRNAAKPPCGVDTTPADGTGCSGGPSQVTVCGECGILYDTNYPIIA